MKKILFIAGILFFILFFININADYQDYINLGIKIFDDGNCFVMGSSSLDPELEYIYFNQGTSSGMTSNENSDWIYFVLVGLIILIVLFILVWFLIKKKQRKRKKKEKKVKIRKGKERKKIGLIKKTLNERQKIIIDILIKEKGKSTQGKLQKLSGIPKASFSRHLNNLAKKGLIIKKGKGRLNTVKLKNKYF